MKTSQYIKISDLKNDDGIAMMGFIIMDLYGMTYEQVDNMNPVKFGKLSKKIGDQFSRAEKPLWFNPLSFNTDAKKITFGQFIDVQYFVQHGNLCDIAATIQRGKNHSKKVERLGGINIRYVLNPVMKFMSSFETLIKAYAGLFEIEEDLSEDIPETPHPFLSQYGWLFSARQVAKDQGVKLNDIFDMNIIEALNTLAYLKSEQSYIKKLQK